MTYEQAVTEIEEIPKYTTKNPLEETRGFYNFLCDNTDFREAMLGKIIHVAGTNGKGSVCSFLNSICQRAGYKTGMFISPHLITTRERFLINSEMISESAFIEGYLELKKRVAEYNKSKLDYKPTYFETLFFIMIFVFKNEGLDYLILETGLGGRLDTTNIIEKPALTVITEIGFDHQAYLGDTIEKIAFEKAGIIKREVPIVFIDKRPEATKVIEERVASLGVKAIKISKNQYKINRIGKNLIDFSVANRYYEYNELKINISALYQVENAAIAIAAANELQDKKIGDIEITEGIAAMKWPGRMEEILPEVFVDGAHNEDGIEAFADTLSTIWKDADCTLVFSAVSDKNYKEMIGRLSKLTCVKNVIVTHIPGSRGAKLDELTHIFEENTSKNIYACEEIKDAVELALQLKGDAGKVFFVGSLYLVGMIKDFVRKVGNND